MNIKKFFSFVYLVLFVATFFLIPGQQSILDLKKIVVKIGKLKFKTDIPVKYLDRDDLMTYIESIFNEEYPDAFMVAEWSLPEAALDGGGFHADFFHWFPGYNDLLQKESWRILNGYSEGHSFFDREGKGYFFAFEYRFGRRREDGY